MSQPLRDVFTTSQTRRDRSDQRTGRACGIVIRSRSLVITPIIFIVLSVFTLVYGAPKGISTVILIGRPGILLLVLGIVAVVLRNP